MYVISTMTVIRRDLLLVGLLIFQGTGGILGPASAIIIDCYVSVICD